MAAKFYLRVRSQVLGPFTQDALQELQGKGQLADSYEISVDGKRWQKVAAIKHLLQPRRSAGQAAPASPAVGPPPTAVPGAAPPPQPVAQAPPPTVVSPPLVPAAPSLTTAETLPPVGSTDAPWAGPSPFPPTGPEQGFVSPPAAGPQPFPCPHCAGPIVLENALAGQSYACPHCGQPFQLGGSQGFSQVGAELAAVGPIRPKTPGQFQGPTSVKRWIVVAAVVFGFALLVSGLFFLMYFQEEVGRHLFGVILYGFGISLGVFLASLFGAAILQTACRFQKIKEPAFGPAMGMAFLLLAVAFIVYGAIFLAAYFFLEDFGPELEQGILIALYCLLTMLGIGLQMCASAGLLAAMIAWVHYKQGITLFWIQFLISFLVLLILGLVVSPFVYFAMTRGS